jgi:hypothetical protein
MHLTKYHKIQLYSPVHIANCYAPSRADRVVTTAHWHICLPHSPTRHQSKQKSQVFPTPTNNLNEIQIILMENEVSTYNQALTLIFSGVVTASTVAYVILTAKLVKETRTMRKNQVEPHIVAYLDITETKADIVYLKTKNIGQGVALNVKFNIEKDINYPKAKSLKSISYFSEGVNYFPPGHEDKHLLFSFMNNKEDKTLDSIIFEIEYESVLKDKRKNKYELKFRELIGKGNLIPPDTHIGNISYRLEKIEKLLQKKFDQ